MKNILFLRRKNLGRGSTRGMVSYLNTTLARSVDESTSNCWEAQALLNTALCIISGRDSEHPLLIRWGCTTESGVPLSSQVNPSHAIRQVNDKLGMRSLLQTLDDTLIPSTITGGFTTGMNALTVPYVLRPRHHAQGRNLFVVNSMQDLLNVVRERSFVFRNGWYASELIDKEAEYRVYVVQGRVATVARKTPSDPSAVAWNVAQGGRFDVVPWGDWPMEAVRVAVEAFKHTDLDFGGVDVMVDRNGRAYCIEINSAPSLPSLSDGSVSYRQKCMAKAFFWMAQHGKDRMDVDNYGGWRGVIHPAIREYA